MPGEIAKTVKNKAAKRIKDSLKKGAQQAAADEGRERVRGEPRERARGVGLVQLCVHERAPGEPKIHHSIERVTGHHSVGIPWLMFAPEENGVEVHAVKLAK